MGLIGERDTLLIEPDLVIVVLTIASWSEVRLKYFFGLQKISMLNYLFLMFRDSGSISASISILPSPLLSGSGGDVF